MAFSKGHIPWNKGKVYEELYGDRADKIRSKVSKKLVFD